MTKRCKCGHHRSVHRGSQTGCSGLVARGKNALGIKQWRQCPCASFRPSERSWWERVVHGTEESSF